jgi:hypothetical protein
MICALNKLLMMGEKLDLVQALREYGIKNEPHIRLAGELNLVSWIVPARKSSRITKKDGRCACPSSLHNGRNSCRTLHLF